MAEKDADQAPKSSFRKTISRHEPIAVDDKGRIRLQDDFNEYFDSPVICMVLLSTGVIKLYSPEEYGRQDRLHWERYSEDNGAAMMLRMVTLSNKRDVKLDGSQRLTIPADFQTEAGIPIKSKCWLVGNGTEVMLLNNETYQTYKKSPLKFKADERKELEQLRKDAFDEEKQLQELAIGRKSI